MGKAFVKEAHVLQPTEIFKSESAGPSRKPLGRTEGRSGIAAPTGVGDRLVLTARRAESSIDHKCAIRNTLGGITPKCKGAFSPLSVSRQLIKLKEGKDVTERILVTRIVRSRNTG